MSKCLNFTKSGLLALPVSDKRYHVYDKKLSALGMTAFPSGSKTFHCRCTVEGRTERLPLGKFPDLPIEAARKACQVKLAEVARGQDPWAEKKAKRQQKARESLTVEAAVDLYCRKQRKGSSEKPLKPKTIQDYKWGIQKFLGKKRFQRPLTDLDRKTIAGCYESRLKQSKARAANEMRSLSAVWNWIARQDAYEDQLPDNPVAAVKAKRTLYKPPPKDGRLIVKGELNELSDWMDEVELLDPVTREFFEWLLFTGNRLGEALGLRWKDINWKTGEYRLEDPKNRERVDLPVPGYLAPRLKARKEKEGPVFPVKNAARMERQEIGEAIEKHWTNHDIRRTFAGIAQSSGIPYTSVKRLMNHSYVDITEMYIGGAADLHKELDQVERTILKLANRKPRNVARLKVAK